LPRIAIEAPAGDGGVIGRTTEEQMHIGIFWGYIDMIEGLSRRIRAQIGRPVKVIATGGLAVLLAQRSTLFDTVEPDLTIKGLGLFYQRAAPR
jgi:type III pantothenate kinase